MAMFTLFSGVHLKAPQTGEDFGGLSNSWRTPQWRQDNREQKREEL